MKKVLHILFDVATYIVIVVGVIFGLPKFLTAALDTNFPMAAITSGSMWPALKIGDLVFIKGVHQGKETGGIEKEASLIPSYVVRYNLNPQPATRDTVDVAIGDIIVFENRDTNTFTIHRVLRLNEKTVVTKGDGNFEEDKPVKYQDIVGKAVTVKGKPIHVPYLGSITVFANNLRQ